MGCDAGDRAEGEGDGVTQTRPSKKPCDKLAVQNPRDLMKAWAMDIGKEVAHHIETMYPEAVKAASSIFELDMRLLWYQIEHKCCPPGGRGVTWKAQRKEQLCQLEGHR
jgi:hypothetical protein